MSYSDLIIWQYKGKPKAVATFNLIESVFGQAFQELAELRNVLDIENAIGEQLDLVGKHIGISRVINHAVLRKFFGFKQSKQALAFNMGEWYRKRDPLSDSVRLNDKDYRFLLKCQIIKNYQTATIPELIQALRFCFGKGCLVTDNGNFTVSITVPMEKLNSFRQFVIKNLDVLPRPAGVRYIINQGA